MTIRHLLVAGTAIAALCIAGCAAFQANPTPSSCAQSTAALSSAQIALTAAQQVLANDQAIAAANPKDAVKVAKVQADENDVAVAQAALTSLQALVSAKCAAVTPTAAATK